MDIVLESISACSVRCKLVPRFYNLTKKEGGNSFRRWIVVTHKVPFKILLKYAKPVLRGKRKREGRVERSRVSVSLFPALCVGYMFISQTVEDKWKEKSRVVSTGRKRTYLSSSFPNFRESGCTSSKTHPGERMRLKYWSFLDSSAFQSQRYT